MFNQIGLEVKTRTVSETQMALIKRLTAFLSDVSQNMSEECLKQNDAIFDPLEQEFKKLEVKTNETPAEPK